MAGTIVVDRIESDASYASTINVAGQITFSNTVNFGVYSGTAPVSGFYLPSANNLAFTTASTERMRIDNQGNVGIGTNSPIYRLQVSGSIKETQSAEAATAGNVQGTFAASFQRTSNDTVFNIGYATTPDAWVLSSTYGTTGAYKPIVFATSDTERMRIDSSGKVGIGNSPFQSGVSTGVAVELSLQSSATSNSAITIQSSLSRFWIATSNTVNALQIGGNGGSMPSLGAINIDSSGYVGIGTVTNYSTLTVNGNITPVAAPSSVWGLDFAPTTAAGSYVTIANNGTYDLAAGSGKVIIYDDAGGGAIEYMCVYGVTSQIWQYNAIFSTTSGTASKINVYYNPGTGKYRIQNLSGSSKSLFITTIRTRASS